MGLSVSSAVWTLQLNGSTVWYQEVTSWNSEALHTQVSGVSKKVEFLRSTGKVAVSLCNCSCTRTGKVSRHLWKPYYGFNVAILPAHSSLGVGSNSVFF